MALKALHGGRVGGGGRVHDTELESLTHCQWTEMVVIIESSNVTTCFRKPVRSHCLYTLQITCATSPSHVSGHQLLKTMVNMVLTRP